MAASPITRQPSAQPSILPPFSKTEAASPSAPAQKPGATSAAPADAFTAGSPRSAAPLALEAPLKSAPLESLFGGAVKEQASMALVSGAGASYTVQAGDTLSGIASRFGTTVSAIAQANGISDPNRIQVGQHLTIPGAGPVTPPPPSSGTYTVKAGDTLSGIASRFGTTVSAIAQANGISDPNRISVGQQLKIPGAGPVTPPPPVTGGSGVISLSQLRAVMPNLPEAKAQQYLPFLNQAMTEAHIDTPARKAAFLAQLAHESVELRYMEEIASGAAYEGRVDLGNTQPGDGVRFKGRGPIQLTGRSNYIRAGNALGLDLVNNPTRAADPDVGFRVAAWYWTTHNCNAMADAGNFIGITRAINGGTNGEASREAYWNRAKQVFG